MINTKTISDCQLSECNNNNIRTSSDKTANIKETGTNETGTNETGTNETTTINNSYPNPSPLIISTCTIISDTGDDIDVNCISRVFPVYNLTSELFESKDGAFSNISLFSDFRRGKTSDSKKNKNHEFNNQVTITFKYWGFRSINIKIFTNGKLQMTGLKYQAEAEYVTLMIIKQLKEQKLKIYTDKEMIVDYLNKYETNSESQENINDMIPNHMYYVFNHNKQEIVYYRKNNILLNKVIEIIYGDEVKYSLNHLFNNSQIARIINRIELFKNKYNNMHEKKLCDIVNKIYSNISENNDTIDNTYDESNHDTPCHNLDNEADLILKEILNYKKRDKCNASNTNTSNIHRMRINSNNPNHDSDNENGSSNNDTYIDIVQNYFATHKNISNKHIIKIILNIISYLNDYFNIDYSIDINVDNVDNDLIVDTLSSLYKYTSQFKNNIVKINKKMKTIHLEDNNLIEKLNCKLLSKINIDIEKKFKEGKLSKDELTKDIKYWEYSIVDIDNKNYKMANIKTELINSDYNTRFNINLSNVSKILKNEYNIYNSYKPDEYPGVLTKYYYNENYKDKGICYCTPHCSTKDKKSICCKITISIFRPGSIIITGAKTIEQLNHTYSFINNVLEKHFNKVQGIDIDDDNKTNQLNNEIRKISRKPRLFYIKRDNIKTINT